jgi:hypothetical protein
MTKMPLAEHNDEVKALSSDRSDEAPRAVCQGDRAKIGRSRRTVCQSVCQFFLLFPRAYGASSWKPNRPLRTMNVLSISLENPLFSMTCGDGGIRTLDTPYQRITV